jgi:hypothetical protein
MSFESTVSSAFLAAKHAALRTTFNPTKFTAVITTQRSSISATFQPAYLSSNFAALYSAVVLSHITAIGKAFRTTICATVHAAHESTFVAAIKTTKRHSIAPAIRTTVESAQFATECASQCPAF